MAGAAIDTADRGGCLPDAIRDGDGAVPSARVLIRTAVGVSDRRTVPERTCDRTEDRIRGDKIGRTRRPRDGKHGSGSVTKGRKSRDIQGGSGGDGVEGGRAVHSEGGGSVDRGFGPDRDRGGGRESEDAEVSFLLPVVIPYFVIECCPVVCRKEAELGTILRKYFSATQR